MAYAQEPVVYRLSLDEVTRLALHNNFDIQIAQYEAQAARTETDVAASIYDTLLNAGINYRKDKSANPSIIAGSRTTDHNYNVGVSQKLPSGTRLGVDVMNNRHFSDSTFLTSPLVHESTLVLTIEQELGTNFLGIQDRGRIKLTHLDVDNKEYTSLDKIERTLARVQAAYWDLALAWERVTIEEQMLRQASRLYDIHKEKLRVGVVEAPEAIAAEVNYEKRKNELSLAQNDLQTKENVLKLLLDQTEPQTRIEPAQDLSLPSSSEDLAESMKKAFNNRRDYRRAFNDIKSRDIELSMSKNNLWPQINLTASLAKNGLGEHFDESLERTIDESNPNFFAGIAISFPFLNTKARAELKAAEFEKAKDIIYLKLIEKTIAVEVMDTVRHCAVLHEVAANNVRISEMQAQKLAAEEKRFNAGRSSTDLLIRFQEDVIEAQLAAALTKHRYKMAVIDLRLAEAALLEEYWDKDL